jgi:hypothetical protein
LAGKIILSFTKKFGMDEYLFSYGTLQDEAVQLATFGRRLSGEPEVLEGFRIEVRLKSGRKAWVYTRKDD